MRRFPLFRRLIQQFHPEAIPGIAAALYDIAGKTMYFRRYYEIMAEDISGFCGAQESVLDIGTGPGRLVIVFHKLCSGLQLTGIDISAAMVSLANRNISKAGLSREIRVCEASADLRCRQRYARAGEAPARSSAFEQGRLRFAGMMACLALTKKGGGFSQTNEVLRPAEECGQSSE